MRSKGLLLKLKQLVEYFITKNGKGILNVFRTKTRAEDLGLRLQSRGTQNRNFKNQDAKKWDLKNRDPKTRTPQIVTLVF